MSVTLTSTTSEHATEVSEVLERLVRTLVSDTKGVSVLALPDKDRTMIRVRVARTDVGKVVGKDGRTARALRVILAAAGQSHGQRFGLDIEEHAEDGA